jgi:hypothetical protein
VKRTFFLYGCQACGQQWWTKTDGVALSDDERVGHECPEDYPPGGMLVVRFVQDPQRFELRQVA